MLHNLNKNHVVTALGAAGLGLLVSPWTFGFSQVAAPTISACILAAALLLVLTAAFAARLDWAGRGSIAVGAWSLIAPFVFGFHQVGEAAWAHVAAGVIAMTAGVIASEIRARPHVVDTAGWRTR
jgi:hypothetical protein